MCRVAPSFLRFGSYQLHTTRGKEDLEIVRRLADYTIDLTSNKYAGKFPFMSFSLNVDIDLVN